MNQANEIAQLMRRAGFALIRKRKHNVWQHPNGSIVVTSQSPSDVHSVRNVAKQLDRLRTIDYM